MNLRFFRAREIYVKIFWISFIDKWILDAFILGTFVDLLEYSVRFVGNVTKILK